jgi:hypothetical protein
VKQQRCESEQFIENNDRVQRFARDFYIIWKEGEREQDSRETKRGCVRSRALQREEDNLSNKIDLQRINM